MKGKYQICFFIKTCSIKDTSTVYTAWNTWEKLKSLLYERSLTYEWIKKNVWTLQKQKRQINAEENGRGPEHVQRKLFITKELRKEYWKKKI